jgi:hypothetical protein
MQQLDKEKRDERLRRMKDIEGITGFTVNIVARA